MVVFIIVIVVVIALCLSVGALFLFMPLESFNQVDYKIYGTQTQDIILTNNSNILVGQANRTIFKNKDDIDIFRLTVTGDFYNLNPNEEYRVMYKTASYNVRLDNLTKFAGLFSTTQDWLLDSMSVELLGDASVIITLFNTETQSESLVVSGKFEN